MATQPVYLLECHEWSDGDEEHEEDHNYHYDIKYFYIVNNPVYKCIFAWNARSDKTCGFPMEIKSGNLHGEKEVDTIEIREAKALVRARIRRDRDSTELIHMLETFCE